MRTRTHSLCGAGDGAKAFNHAIYTLHHLSLSPALDLLFFINYVYMRVCVRVCACECGCTQKPEVSGPLELDTGTGNRSGVPWKASV